MACGIPSTLSDLRGVSCWGELRNRQPECSSVGSYSAGARDGQIARLLLGDDRCRFSGRSEPGTGAENTLFLALARLIGALPVAQRLQLLEIVSNGLEPVHTEAAATEA